jgi:hypothetical protein
MKLPSEIASAVEPLMGAQGGIGSVEFLPLPRLVADSAEKAIVFTPEARPALVVMIAPPAYPDAVRDAYACAAAARLALGEGAIGSAVQVALCEGVTEGRSFAVVPYLTPMGRGRLRRRWDRLRLRGPVLAWLREVTRRTVVILPEAAVPDSVAKPLRGLAGMEVVGERVRAAARDSLRALDSGHWQPRWVLAHNDFWLGNFLFRRPEAAGMPGFAVIDWGASQVRGYPLYDFLSFANSVDLSSGALRRRLGEYCSALGCAPAEARFHLMAALAALSTRLGEWPVRRFAATAERLLFRLEAAQ